MKKLLIVCLIALIGILFWYYQKYPLGSKVKIRDQVFSVEVAVSEAEKQRGLSGRQSLPGNAGMLFVYDHKEQYHFWMKDMRFPLDFIWIDGRTVIDLTPNVFPPKPGERLVFIKPKVPADKILEVNAGTITTVGVQIGDTVEFLDR